MPSRIALRPTQPPVQWAPGLSQGQSNQSMVLTSHLFLWLGWSYTSVPAQACHGLTFQVMKMRCWWNWLGIVCSDEQQCWNVGLCFLSLQLYLLFFWKILSMKPRTKESVQSIAWGTPVQCHHVFQYLYHLFIHQILPCMGCPLQKSGVSGCFLVSSALTNFVFRLKYYISAISPCFLQNMVCTLCMPTSETEVSSA
jgi:hypothetical protein